jgi:filamentous hemagglutinin
VPTGQQQENGDLVVQGGGGAPIAGGKSGVTNTPSGGPKVPPNLQPLTNPAQGPVIPSDWVSKPGRAPGSTIYCPPGTDPSASGSTYIRVMPPGSTPVPGLENGYWVSIQNGQPINPATGGTGPRSQTHVPLPPNTMPPTR